MKRVVLARYGEIALKGRNRGIFEGMLARNMRRALVAQPGFRLSREYGRIYVEPKNPGAEGRVLEVAQTLRQTFGLVGVCPAVQAPLEYERVAEAAVLVAREAYALRPNSITFKIDARRSEKRFPKDSMTLNRELGGAVLDAIPKLKVDVHRPDIRVSVEVRQEGAFVYADDLPCSGGLPVGMSGRVMALLSGGIDSPVALWMAMKRGLSVDALHFETPPFTGTDARMKVIDLCRLLSEWGGPDRLHVVNFTPLQKLIWGRCPAELRVTLMRRLFLQIAQRLADAARAEAIVTGDSVGQVASQTLTSLRVIEDGIELPVLRPVVGFDKTEIVARAREIGTFEISIRPFDDCCALFVPEHPSTRPDLQATRAAQQGVGDAEVEAAIGEAIAHRDVLSFRARAARRDASIPAGAASSVIPEPVAR